MKGKDKMHILMIIPSFSPLPMGGSERQAFHLAKKLKAFDQDVSIFSFGKKGVPEEELMEGINLYRMQFASVVFNFLSYIRGQLEKTPVMKVEYDPTDLNNFIISDKKSFFSFINYFFFLMNCMYKIKRKNVHFDVIYIPTMEWAAFIGAVMGRIYKKNVLIKDSTVNGITNLLRYPFGSRMQKFIMQKCYFVAMTDAIKKNYLQTGIPKNKIEKIPNGVEVQPDNLKRSAVNPAKFLFVGNLYQQPAKGIDVLLKAWKKVVQSISSAELFVAGDGNTKEYYSYLEKLGMSGHVHFLGKQNNLRPHYSDAYAFVLPSRIEGMSNSLLEAMSYGLPCIATDISGNQDIIKQNINGMLVPVQDETRLADAIIYLYNNPEKAKQMGAEARKTIEESYTLQQVSEKYIHLFHKIILSFN